MKMGWVTTTLRYAQRDSKVPYNNMSGANAVQRIHARRMHDDTGTRVFHVRVEREFGQAAWRVPRALAGDNVAHRRIPSTPR